MNNDVVVKESLGAHIVDEFVTAKNIEWDRYRNCVTKWEIDTYLNAY